MSRNAWPPPLRCVLAATRMRWCSARRASAASRRRQVQPGRRTFLPPPVCLIPGVAAWVEFFLLPHSLSVAPLSGCRLPTVIRLRYHPTVSIIILQGSRHVPTTWYRSWRGLLPPLLILRRQQLQSRLWGRRRRWLRLIRQQQLAAARGERHRGHAQRRPHACQVPPQHPRAAHLAILLCTGRAGRGRAQ